MPRFNAPAVNPTLTTNLAGGQAFQESPELELASILVTSFVQDQFYRSANDTLGRVAEIIAALPDKRFAAKAAIYARNVFGMRSITHVVAAELTPHLKALGRQLEIAKASKDSAKLRAACDALGMSNIHDFGWGRRFFSKVVRRPDDMTEIAAYAINRFGRKDALIHPLLAGFGDAFTRFNGYQLAKYKAGRQAFRLVDAMKLSHTKPTAQNADALALLKKGELASTDTWEAKLSKAGQDAKAAENVTDEQREELEAELKDAAWSDLLKERKLGYFALLRNLRNICQQSPENIGLACEQLVNEDAIKKSLVMPFRYMTAIFAIREAYQKAELSNENFRKVVDALSQAIDIATVNNVPKLAGKTLVALDTSGSMGDFNWSGYVNTSKTHKGPAVQYSPITHGIFFTAVLARALGAEILMFSDKAAYCQYDPTYPVMAIVGGLVQARLNGGTDFRLIFQAARERYDRIIILSDEQGWVGYDAPTKEWAEYRNKFLADPHIFSFDLAGYGTLQFPERKVYCLAGFSSEVLQVLSKLEEDRNALVNAINAVEL